MFFDALKNDKTMHLKSLLLASIFICSVPAVAQHKQQESLGFTMKAGQKTIKTDTVVKISRDKRPLLAEAREETVVKSGKYKPVPLAGHKSYFGDQNDYMMGYCKQYLEAHTHTLSVVRERSNQRF